MNDAPSSPSEYDSTKATVKLTLHGDVLDRPLLHQLSRLFDVPAVIRYAKVGPYTGLLVLDLMAIRADIETALAWLAEEGVDVELLAMGPDVAVGNGSVSAAEPETWPARPGDGSDDPMTQLPDGYGGWDGAP